MRHSVCLLLIALFASVAPLQAMAASDIPDDVKVRCKADYSRLCSGIMPGGGRVLACFQAHKDEVSPDCADALSKMKN
ncbi:MAG: cysteine rich repeat-containing protein [Methylocystis sp.]